MSIDRKSENGEPYFVMMGWSEKLNGFVVETTADSPFNPVAICPYRDWADDICRVMNSDDRRDFAELLDIATKLVNWCDENPPAGQSLYFVELARNAVTRLGRNRRAGDES